MEDLVPIPVVLSQVKKSVTTEMNEALLKPYTAEQVRKALFDIGDLRARLPDRLHVIFYKRFGQCLVMIKLRKFLLLLILESFVKDGTTL